MTPPSINPRPELEERLRFETLIADLSSKFINLPAGEVDREIEDAQRRVCECLGFDLCALWQWTQDAPRYITISHLYRPLGGPPPPGRIDGEEMAPWTLRQIATGRIVAVASMESLPAEAARDKEVWLHYGIKSALNFPLSAGGQLFGAVTFNTVREERAWPTEIVTRLTVVAQVFANALARKVTDQALRESMAENERLRERLQAESDYLKAEIKVTQAHGEVIGRSRAIRQVLSQVEQVAPTDSSVLIRGETGTGKELIAQAIHRLSPRQAHLMVKVNCAALPSALVESELFGREKGAFTGALTRQIGRFEVADGSTIFLDEIGELSLDVQAKLLRVLQEGQFERLGSPNTIKVNVRVIAATNRDLAEDLRAGRFRKDLFYRLNVFPIRVPPLRERAEDIPMLVWAFLKELSSRMGKKISQVPRQTMEALQSHPWPGNVRELRNVIEHGAIVTSGDTLRVPMLLDADAGVPPPETLASSEQEHILKALEKTGWRIKGPRGAATMLGVNPSTLYSRMQKLGIPNRRQKKTAGT
jgi:transcriptional regulator with GAF, ATPase, and Fis domain